MKALIINPIQRTVSYQDIIPGLRALQDIVGGYIEAVPAATVPTSLSRADITLFVNEDGLLLGLQPWLIPNYIGDPLVGPAVLVGRDPNGRDVDLAPEIALLAALDMLFLDPIDCDHPFTVPAHFYLAHRGGFQGLFAHCINKIGRRATLDIVLAHRQQLSPAVVTGLQDKYPDLVLWAQEIILYNM